MLRRDAAPTTDAPRAGLVTALCDADADVLPRDRRGFGRSRIGGPHDRDGLSGRKSPRERRKGPTSEDTARRGIPAEVRRFVMTRALGHCEYPACTNGTFLQFCHIRAHVAHGDREPGNLVLLCSQHHTMMDLGRIAFFERTARGVAFVLAATGEVIEPHAGRCNPDVLPEAVSEALLGWRDQSAPQSAPLLAPLSGNVGNVGQVGPERSRRSQSVASWLCPSGCPSGRPGPAWDRPTRRAQHRAGRRAGRFRAASEPRAPVQTVALGRRNGMIVGLALGGGRRTPHDRTRRARCRDPTDDRTTNCAPCG